MPRSLLKPLVVFALPGAYLVYKISELKRNQQEQCKRKVTERELANLNQKIEKLLAKLEDHQPEVATCQEEECVICITSRATMQTFPCGHRVICQKCFIKTIQVAVSQRMLPLQCVVCRTKILRLKQTGHRKEQSCATVSHPSADAPLRVPRSSSFNPLSFRGRGMFRLHDVTTSSQEVSCVLHKHKKPKLTTKRSSLPSNGRSFSAESLVPQPESRESTHLSHRLRRTCRRRSSIVQRSSGLCPISEKEELEVVEVSATVRCFFPPVSDKGKETAAANERVPEPVPAQVKSSPRRKAFSVFGLLQQQLRSQSPLKAFRDKYRQLT